MSTEVQTYDAAREIEAVRDVEVLGMPALQAIVKAEIDTSIATARAFPRDITLCLRKATTMATLSEETAAQCFYSIPRDGKQIEGASPRERKQIEGASVRLAEIIQIAWGNMRVAGRIIDEGERFVVAMGVAHDLESNSSRAFEVRRRITDRRGRRYSDDMIVTTCNAAVSIACREAILKLIPRALWEPVFMAARRAAAGSIETIHQKREKWLAYWGTQGVTPAEVFNALGVAGRDGIGLDQIAQCVGWRNGIDEKETTLDAIFRPVVDEAVPGSTATGKLAEKLKGRKEGKLGESKAGEGSTEAKE
jgi:hypothetical protein